MTTVAQFPKGMLGGLGARSAHKGRKESAFLKDKQNKQGSTAAVFKPSLEEFSTCFVFKGATLNCCLKGEKERREETEEVENVREPHIGHLQ